MRRVFASPPLLAIYALALVALFAASDVRADEIVVDLKGGASPAVMAPSGPMQPGTVFWEAEGLRVKLAADRKALDHVGTRTRFAVSGDFEIVAACDLIEAPAKSSVFGSGARLFVKFDSPKGEVASLSRVRREAGGDVYLAYFVWKDANGKQQESQQQIPTKSKAGWLRLRRAGDQLSFEASDDGKEYRPIMTKLVGTGDVQELSLTATTAKFAAGTEVRWKELRVSASGLGTRPTLAKQEPSRWWLYLLGGALVVAVVVAVPVGIMVRKKR